MQTAHIHARFVTLPPADPMSVLSPRSLSLVSNADLRGGQWRTSCVMLCAVCDFHRDMTTHSIASSAARCAPLSALRSRSSASICVLLPRPLRPELCQRSRGACQCECVWSQLLSCTHNHVLQVTKQLRALLFACDASLQCVSACYYEVVRKLCS